MKPLSELEKFERACAALAVLKAADAEVHGYPNMRQDQESDELQALKSASLDAEAKWRAAAKLIADETGESFVELAQRIEMSSEEDELADEAEMARQQRMVLDADGADDNESCFDDED